MKRARRRIKGFCAAAFLSLAAATVVQAQNLQLVVGSTSDPVRWPGNEDPAQAINWVGQKYLNFEGEVRPSGFYVRPGGPNADDIATGITFWTANDAIPRDPASYELWGSNSADLSAPLDYFHQDEISLDLWTAIASGDLALPDSRNGGGQTELDDANSQTITFGNTAPYDNYLVMFPTVKNAGGANSMQIAEVQLNYDGSDIANGIFDTFDEITGVALFDLDPAKGDPIGPQAAPTKGNWSIREWLIPDAFGNVGNVDEAIAFTTDERVQGTNFAFDGMSNLVNHADPNGAGGGYSINIDKQPFFSDTPAADDDIVFRARGKVIIPSNGDYTFGVDGDDGYRLFVDGEVLSEFVEPTGNAFTLASKNLTAGEHDVELVWFERGGGAFVELFAAPGDKAELDDSFSPIGLAEAIPVAKGTTATTTGDWSIRTVQVDTSVFGQTNSIATAQAAVDLPDGDPGILDAVDTEEITVNYGGANGRFQGEKIPFEVAGDDFAVKATNTVVIPEDGDYIFGFGGDDGGRICVADADFTLLAERNNAQGVSGGGTCVEWDGNTGNSDTFGTTFMTAGEHAVDVLWWERGGGDWLEVYTGLGTSATGALTFQLLGDDATEYDLTIQPGLQLGGEPAVDPFLPADFDENGTVDFTDFLLLSSLFGQSVDPPGTDPDIDGNGTVDFPDFLVLSSTFGQSAAAAAVPEPSSILLFGLGSLLLGLTRRRRR